MAEQPTATDPTKALVPYHLQGPEPLDKQKWYLQSEYLQPRVEISRDVQVKDFGINTCDVLSAAHEGKTMKLRNLLARGGCVNAVGGFGKTPLHYAVESGHQQTVEYLLHNEANVNAQDKNGEGALHVAARAGHLDIVQALLRNKATRDMRNHYDKTPRDIAKDRGHSDCVRELYVIDIMSGEDKYAPDKLLDEEAGLTRVPTKELRLLRMGIFRARTVAKANAMRYKVNGKLLANLRKEFVTFKREEYDPLVRKYDDKVEEMAIAQEKFDDRGNVIEDMKGMMHRYTDERHKAFMSRDTAIAALEELQRSREDDSRGMEFARNRMKNDIADLEKQRNEAREKTRAVEEERDRLTTKFQRAEDQLQNANHDIAAGKDEIARLKRVLREQQVDLDKAREKFESSEKNGYEYKLRLKKFENVIIDLKRQQKLLKEELQVEKDRNATRVGGADMGAIRPAVMVSGGGWGHHPLRTPLPPEESGRSEKYSRGNRSKKHKHRKHRRR
jgi:hypothetical protein